MQTIKDCLRIGKVVWSEVSFNNSGMSREVHVPLCERLAGRFRRSTRLFANSVSGANAAAVIYSLIETCKFHKISAYHWLSYVLREIPKSKNRADLEKLLPFNVKPEDLKIKLPDFNLTHSQ